MKQGSSGPFLNKLCFFQFWEADHIKAVAEGGGECGLENYRTLCTPCHRSVTKKLRIRLNKQRNKEGMKDIKAFFKPPSQVGK